MASEVNEKALKKTDVFSLIKEITEAEQDLNINVTNKSVKRLMDLYQKAIEYYSALDNKCFEDFLNRMTNLFKREDIQKALARPDEDEEEKGEEKIVTTKDGGKREPDKSKTEKSSFESDQNLTNSSINSEEDSMLG